MDDTLKAAGEKALSVAMTFWNQKIEDPAEKDTRPEAIRNKKFISDIIRTPEGINWTWEDDYKGDGDFAWCGAFVAACWAKAGLKLAIREKDFASTYRLDRYAKADKKNPGTGITLYDGKFRKYSQCNNLADIKEFGPRAGDILLVGDRQGYGTHICLVASYDVENSIIYTVEGNGFGAMPGGLKGEGVIQRTRRVEKDPLTGRARDVRRLIRPSFDDLT